MTKKIFLNGIQYVGSKDAGKEVGYSYDYVSRLARQGVVKAKKVGTSWFVDPKSLQSFAKNQKINTAVRSKQLSKQVTGAMGTANKVNSISPSFASKVNIPHGNVSAGFSSMVSSSVGSGMSAMGMANRVVALVTATSLVFGLYSFTDHQYAGYARIQTQKVLDDIASAIIDTPKNVIKFTESFDTGFNILAQSPVSSMLGASAVAYSTLDTFALKTKSATDSLFSYFTSSFNKGFFTSLNTQTVVHIGVQELPAVEQELRALVAKREFAKVYNTELGESKKVVYGGGEI